MHEKTVADEHVVDDAAASKDIPEGIVQSPMAPRGHEETAVLWRHHLSSV